MKLPKVFLLALLVLILGSLTTACNLPREPEPEPLPPPNEATTVPAEPNPTIEIRPISRPQDPVILTGADFPEFLNLPINELRLYANYGSDWTPIPFQVDEVDTTGSIVPPGNDDDDNGLYLLDANDQIVFMGHDAGVAADCSTSLDLIPQSHLRETVAITDTLNGDTGIAYLYHSASLPASTDSYLTWNQATQTITGTYQNEYVATFGGAKDPQFLGLADLSINGSDDIVDRQKLVLDFDVGLSALGCFNWNCPFTEEGSSNPLCNVFWDYMQPYITMFFPSVGAVRAVSEYGFAFYGSMFDANLVIDFSAVEQNENVCADSLVINQFLIATDLNDPTSHGVNTYFDSNAATAVIDGIPDTVPSSPPIGWYQTSGGTYGGVVTALNAIYPEGVTASTHYVDNSASGGTGDGASYGEAGVAFSDAGAGTLGFQLTTYILPPGTSENLGATYKQYATTPLTTATNPETCASIQYPVYLPLMLTSAGD